MTGVVCFKIGESVFHGTPLVEPVVEASVLLREFVHARYSTVRSRSVYLRHVSERDHGMVKARHLFGEPALGVADCLRALPSQLLLNVELPVNSMVLAINWVHCEAPPPAEPPTYRTGLFGK